MRGALDGIPHAAPSARPFAEFARELGAVIPPFPFVHLYRAGGARLLATNVAAAIGIALAAVALARATGNYAQWGAMGLGLYAAAARMKARRVDHIP